MSPTTRTRLARLHRWLALALSPVIALLLISGIVLAFQPILGRDGPPPDAFTGRVDVTRVVALLDSLDPQGRARGVFLDPTGRALAVGFGNGRPQFHDLATGRIVPPPAQMVRTPDIFDVARRVHGDLWIGADALVTLASIAMIVLVVLGPVLSRPRAGRTALAWHIRTGWLLWPLVALAPLSLVMMKLHRPVAVGGSHTTVAPARAIEQAARTIDVSHLAGVQALPGATLLVTVVAGDVERYVLQDGRVRPLDSGISKLGRELHEGTWAGPWSGVVSAIAALVTLAMLVTGWRSWLQRWRATRRVATRRAVPRAA